MPGGPTQAGIDYILNLLRNAEQAVARYFVALTTLPPGFTAGGEDLSEPNFAEYARAELLNDSDSWTLVDTTMTNTAEVTFPTAVTDWGQVNYWALCEFPMGQGGRVFYCGQLEEPLWVETGQQAFLGIGDLGLPISGNQWLMGTP